MELNVIQHTAADGARAAPLVVAHGLFGSARNFNTLGRKLATDRHVMLVDMRNHGLSPWDGDVSYASMADDLAGVIETRCDGKALVLGHSMGGKAAMALALSHPDLVAGAIIADIAPVTYAHTHLPYIKAMRAMDLTRIARRSDADPMLAEAVSDPALRSFLLQNLVIEENRARWRLNLAALEQGMPGLTGWPAGDFEGAVYAGPCHFLYGGASYYMDEEHAPLIREAFPAATFEAIDGAGHWLHAEKPAEFLLALQGWLASRG